jgi:hypothetical protein
MSSSKWFSFCLWAVGALGQSSHVTEGISEVSEARTERTLRREFLRGTGRGAERLFAPLERFSVRVGSPKQWATKDAHRAILAPVLLGLWQAGQGCAVVEVATLQQRSHEPRLQVAVKLVVRWAIELFGLDEARSNSHLETRFSTRGCSTLPAHYEGPVQEARLDKRTIPRLWYLGAKDDWTQNRDEALRPLWQLSFILQQCNPTQ